MKKIYILAAIALVAGVSCTKQVPADNNSPDVPIGFSPISQRAATKATYFGEQNALYTGNGSAYESFLAYAAFTEDNITVPLTNFFPAAGEECSYNATDDYWAPAANTYYWPKAGFLTFHAFSPSVLDNGYSATITNAWPAGITLSNFIAGTDMAKQIDILYSDFNAYQQRSMYNPETGTPYDDKTGDTGTHNGVNLIFRHAMSAVQFRVVTDQDYTSGSQKHSFVITKIEVLDANNKGEFHENRSAVNNTYDNAAAGSVTFNQDNSIANSPYWVPTANEVTNYTVFEGSKAVLTKTASDAATNKEFGLYGNLMLPMPQLLGGHGASADKDVVVKVTYNYTYNDGSDHTTNGLTTEISLAGKNGTYAGGTAGAYTVNQWLINHKYLYTLVFKLDPIIFDPKVEAFVEVSDINVDLPYQN